MTLRPLVSPAPRMPGRRAALLLALPGLLCLFAPAPASAQSVDLPCPQDRLYNGGFEGGFNARGRLDLRVALGWQPWVQGVDLSAADAGVTFLPLDRRRAPDTGLVQQGLWSQGVQGLGDDMPGGLWQRARVPMGSRLLVYAWGGVGPRSDPFDRSGGAPAPSPAWRLRLGLDPRGGSDPALARLGWTEAVTLTEGWAPLVLPPVTAEASAVTLFLEGRPVGAAAGSQLRWDSACLGLPEAEPLPTARGPLPVITLDPRTPQLPPPATLALILAGQAEATARAAALEARATARAARPQGLRRTGAGAGGGGAPNPGQYGPLPEEPLPAVPSLAARLYDLSGLAALLLAALLAGVLLGQRGSDGRGAAPPRAPS